MGASADFSEYVFHLTDALLPFDLKKTFECGQCFRWNLREDFYEAVVSGHLLRVSLKDNDFFVKVYPKCDGLYEFLYNYFDFGVNYNEINRELEAKDSILKKAVYTASGIRLLNQDFFETLISFIISANNNIPRIKKCIELLCENYGKILCETGGKKYYSFPEPKTLAELKPEELQKIARVGYRGDYIVNSAKYYSENPGVYDVLKHTESESEVLKLMKAFKGCGNKVSNCVLLFSGLRRDAFPVDVWVERMLVNLYGLKDMNRLQMEKFGKEYFGKSAGISQQYLFYYVREEG